jgi:hypothetical protein
MTFGKNIEILRLRPHHILCDRFLPLNNLNRGEEFNQAMHAIRERTTSESNSIITIVEGPDQLCEACPVCKNNRCESPYGNEEEVRKWDSKIIKGLEISYGKKISVREIHTLINKKTPLEFCLTRCPWKTVCNVFQPG